MVCTRTKLAQEFTQPHFYTPPAKKSWRAEVRLQGKLQANRGCVTLQHRGCRSNSGLEILRRTRSFPERTSSAGSVAAILWQLRIFVYRERTRLAAAQAFRSLLLQDAAEYVRLNVLPRARRSRLRRSQAGPVTSWTRRGSARRRWSAARRRPLRRRRPWLRRRARLPLPPRAWAEPLGTWGAWRKEQQPWRPPQAGVGAAETAGLAVGIAGGAAYGRAARDGCWRTRSSGPSRAARTSGPPTKKNRKQGVPKKGVPEKKGRGVSFGKA